MVKNASGSDRLFLKAEQLANDFSLFRQQGDLSREKCLDGLVKDKAVDRILKQLRKLKVDRYIQETVSPTEVKSRPSAKAILKKCGDKIIKETSFGPLYAAEIELTNSNSVRRIGFLTQDRSSNNGVWMPEHHLKAVEIIREFSEFSLPMVTLIDTPGADAGEIANSQNQAHSISRLLMEMSVLDMPTIAIVLGNGYSGGAIPLATTNIILSVRDGVFNTIQPRGLASIARKYNLSWQECAKYVGVSSFELYKQGYIDGIIDFVPGEEGEKLANLKKAIFSGILSIENNVKEFIAQNPYVFNHYRRSVDRFIDPSTSLTRFQEQSNISQARNPTCYLSIFGITYRYMRYLSLRSRICSTTIQRYGRLSEQEIPKGDLTQRIEKEHKDAFSQWLGRPLEIKYDSTLSKSWKDYQYFKDHLRKPRGKLRKFILGDPIQNFDDAMNDLNLLYGFHLYNLWKTGAQSQFHFLSRHLESKKKTTPKIPKNPTVLDIIESEEIKPNMIQECRNFIIFDLLYDNIVKNLLSVAREAKVSNTISKDSISTLLKDSLSQAVTKISPKLPSKESKKGSTKNELKTEFIDWLNHFINHSKRSQYLKSVEEWKKIAHPRIPEPLFAIITFFFEHLLPNYYASRKRGNDYDGALTFVT